VTTRDGQERPASEFQDRCLKRSTKSGLLASLRRWIASSVLVTQILNRSRRRRPADDLGASERPRQRAPSLHSRSRTNDSVDDRPYPVPAQTSAPLANAMLGLLCTLDHGQGPITLDIDVALEQCDHRARGGDCATPASHCSSPRVAFMSRGRADSRRKLLEINGSTQTVW
jgi:hypothetical protein